MHRLQTRCFVDFYIVLCVFLLKTLHSSSLNCVKRSLRLKRMKGKGFYSTELFEFVHNFE